MQARMTFDIAALESFDSVKGDVNTLLTLASELILEADKKKKVSKKVPAGAPIGGDAQDEKAELPKKAGAAEASISLS